MNETRIFADAYQTTFADPKLIYQHVFEERTFDDMSRINGLSPYKVKGIYYYAIRKIRKWMGGAR